MTELERLRAWMAANGYDTNSLKRKLGFHRSIDDIINGKKYMHLSFKHQFGLAFGFKVYGQIFDFPKTIEAFRGGMRDKFWHPEKHAAHRSVQKAILAGELPPPSTYKCHGCGRQAQQWHHEDYLPENHLCVVPLCVKCHRQHHTGKKKLSFGSITAS